jgi:hypothetical protein
MLDRKGAIYSDRPILHMAGELAGFNKWTGGLAYGLRWRESRKYMHNAIGTRESLDEFQQRFESETRKFLKATLRDPDNLQQHVRQYVIHSLFEVCGRERIQGYLSVPQAQSLSLLHMAMKHKKRMIPSLPLQILPCVILSDSGTRERI